MSRANVDLVKRLYEAWQRDGLGVVPELMDPDIEWVNPPNAIEPGTRRGYDGFAAAAESFAGVYPESRVTEASFHDAEDRIAVSATMSSRGGGSEFPIETQRGYVFELRDGRVTRFSWFTDPLEAIAAVGLTAHAGDGGRQESQDNIGVVRDQYAATNERDFARAMAHYDADVELVVWPGYVDPGEYRGREAVGAWFGDWFSSFDRDARFDVKEMTELDDDTVLLVADHHARGRRSGVEVHGTVVWLYTLRRGKIARVRAYETRADALEDMGLAE